MPSYTYHPYELDTAERQRLYAANARALAARQGLVQSTKERQIAARERQAAKGLAPMAGTQMVPAVAMPAVGRGVTPEMLARGGRPPSFLTQDERRLFKLLSPEDQSRYLVSRGLMQAGLTVGNQEAQRDAEIARLAAEQEFGFKSDLAGQEFADRRDLMTQQFGLEAEAANRAAEIELEQTLLEQKNRLEELGIQGKQQQDYLARIREQAEAKFQYDRALGQQDFQDTLDEMRLDQVKQGFITGKYKFSDKQKADLRRIENDLALTQSTPELNEDMRARQLARLYQERRNIWLNPTETGPDEQKQTLEQFIRENTWEYPGYGLLTRNAKGEVIGVRSAKQGEQQVGQPNERMQRVMTELGMTQKDVTTAQLAAQKARSDYIRSHINDKKVIGYKDVPTGKVAKDPKTGKSKIGADGQLVMERKKEPVEVSVTLKEVEADADAVFKSWYQQIGLLPSDVELNPYSPAEPLPYSGQGAPVGPFGQPLPMGPNAPMDFPMPGSGGPPTAAPGPMPTEGHHIMPEAPTAESPGMFDRALQSAGDFLFPAATPVEERRKPAGFAAPFGGAWAVPGQPADQADEQSAQIEAFASQFPAELQDLARKRAKAEQSGTMGERFEAKANLLKAGLKRPQSQWTPEYANQIAEMLFANPDLATYDPEVQALKAQLIQYLESHATQ